MPVDGDNRVTPADRVIPHIEVKFVRDEADRTALRDRIPAQITDSTIPSGPLELGITYKLYLCLPKDFEDAVRLYALLEQNLRPAVLERWVERLGAESDYARLRAA